MHSVTYQYTGFASIDALFSALTRSSVPSVLSDILALGMHVSILIPLGCVSSAKSHAIRIVLATDTREMTVDCPFVGNIAGVDPAACIIALYAVPIRIQIQRTQPHTSLSTY